MAAEELGPSCPSRPWVPGFLTWKGTAWLQNKLLHATVRGLTRAALSSYELPQLRKAFNGLNVSQNRESEPRVTPITRYDHYVKD